MLPRATAVVIAFALVMGGRASAFVFCHAMNVRMAACCREQPTPAATATLSRACCESKSEIDKAPVAPPEATTSLAPPIALPLLPTLAPAPSRSLCAPTTTPTTLARPPPERRASLSIWTC